MRPGLPIPFCSVRACLTVAALIASAPAGAESVRHTFDPLVQDVSAGPSPQSVVRVGGMLYGTTQNGGTGNCTNGCGTFFSIAPDGTYTTLYSFQAGQDGAYPNGPLAVISNVIYGATISGGNAGGCCGTVFSFTTTGQKKIIYAFKGSPDGGAPNGVLNSGGMLLGSTSFGGRGCAFFSGCGTVFSLSPTGVYQQLCAFAGDADGARPSGPPVALNGDLYGVTFLGGLNSCESGCGTLYKLGAGSKHTVLYQFQNKRDGANPSSLVLAGGGLVGTAQYGGIASGPFVADFGSVFRATTNGKITVIHDFNDYQDGANPSGLVVIGQDAYGLTYMGGAACGTGAPCSGGTVFSVTQDKGFALRYIFKGGKDPYIPTSLSATGKSLAGVSLEGGDEQCYNSYGCGTVFTLTP
jgi:uncharacterized repeat protein (TIGR03803 family)